MAKRAARDKWILWSQHWVGYKPRRLDTFYDFEEAKKYLDGLNSSPSAQWYFYSLEFKPAADRIA